jgi:tRNA A-37 threonylcarbamoyl transferase component Bud32
MTEPSPRIARTNRNPVPVLDFVCSEGLVLQKELGRKNGSYGRIRLLRVFVQEGSLLLLSALAGFALSNVLIPNNALAGPFMLGVFVYALFAVTLHLQKGKVFMPFPTNLRTGPAGLSLVWWNPERQSNPIPWSAIECVTIADDMLHLEINTNYTDASWLAIASETAGLWNGCLPFARSERKFNLRSIGLSFPLTSLTLDSDRPKLLAAIESNIGRSSVTQSIEAASVHGAASSYTQLWLDDLHSFNRSRIDELAPGCTLQEGRYEVASLAGSGGQAKIYRALDWYSGLPVVLKEIVLPLHGGLDMRERAFDSVKNEALLLSKLSHPGIVILIDHFVEDHRAYLVLEHIEGRTLRQLVQEDGPLPVAQVRAIAVAVCNVLGYLHQSSPVVLHRDLSPDNLMIDKESKIKLIDFSVAQDASKTSSRTVVGKNNYIAPEQFRGSPTTKSDLYSLGATLYFLLTGSDPVAISSSRPSDRLGVACPLDDIVFKLTELDPALRYAEAGEVLTDLLPSAQSS